MCSLVVGSWTAVTGLARRRRRYVVCMIGDDAITGAGCVVSRMWRAATAVMVDRLAGDGRGRLTAIASRVQRRRMVGMADVFGAPGMVRVIRVIRMVRMSRVIRAI